MEEIEDPRLILVCRNKHDLRERITVGKSYILNWEEKSLDWCTLRGLHLVNSLSSECYYHAKDNPELYLSEPKDHRGLIEERPKLARWFFYQLSKKYVPDKEGKIWYRHRNGTKTLKMA